MEEFVICGMHPLATVVGFDKVATLVTLVLKLRVPLSKFVAIHRESEDDVQFLARVGLEAEGIVGSYTRPEHDACITNLRNGGRLNRVFQLAEVAYGPQPEPGTKEFTEASKKRRLDAAGKNLSKRLRVLGKKIWKLQGHLCCKDKLAPMPQGKTVVPWQTGGLK
jgi:hypothetical protein